MHVWGKNGVKIVIFFVKIMLCFLRVIVERVE